MPTRTAGGGRGRRCWQLRPSERRGQDWLGAELGVPARTVSRILRRHQVPYLRELRPDDRAGDPGLARPPRSATNATGPASWSTWTSRSSAGSPTAAAGGPTAGTARDHQRRINKARIGYDYVHSLVDDHSRLAYCEILPDEKGPTCAGFLARAAAYFADHGITRIERVMTDNAWAYRCVTARGRAPTWAPGRSSSARTAPGRTARSNGSTAPWPPNGPTGRSSPATTERAAALAPWLEHYNTRRRHSALGGLPPISRLPPT